MQKVQLKRVPLKELNMSTMRIAEEMLDTATTIKQKHTSLEVALLGIGEVHAGRLNTISAMLSKTESLLFRDEVLEDLNPALLINLVNSLKADLHTSTKEVQSISKSIDPDELETKVVLTNAVDVVDAEAIEFSEIAADLLREVSAQ